MASKLWNEEVFGNLDFQIEVLREEIIYLDLKVYHEVLQQVYIVARTRDINNL